MPIWRIVPPLLLMRVSVASQSSLGALIGNETSIFYDQFEHSWYHFSCYNNTCGRNFSYLWSMDIMAHAVSGSGSRPLKFEKDVKIVKNGKTFFTSQEPATWDQMQTGLLRGASLVMNGVQHFHRPAYQLCSALEKEMTAWAYANAYSTPANQVGFQPHIDPTDSLIVQVEGSKEWQMCQRIPYRGKTPGQKTHFQDSDLQNCTHVLMSPGDVMYIPVGTIHVAKASKTGLSLHLTITICRLETTWMTLLQDIADPSHDETESLRQAIADVAAQSLALHKQIPLGQFARSIDNKDLPPNTSQEWRKKCKALLQHFPVKLKNHLLNQLKSKSAWVFALNNMRQRLAIGTLPDNLACIPSSLIDLQKSYFRRLPTSRAVMAPQNGMLIFGVHGKYGPINPSWKAGVRFALASFDPSTAQGKPFRLKDLQVSLGDTRSAEAEPLLSFLLQRCALEYVQPPMVARETGKAEL